VKVVDVVNVVTLIIKMANNFISVLLPTRKRVDLVKKSISSVLDLADNPDAIQIAVAYDYDDTDSDTYFLSKDWNQFVELRGARQIVLRTKNVGGFTNLYEYYNCLADYTDSKWILIWNDDAVMLSQGWDTEIWNNRNWHGMLTMESNCRFDHARPDQALFPAIPRTWHTLFGKLASCTIDVWIGDICREVDAIKVISSEIFHDHADVTGNNNDEIFQLNWDKTKRRNLKRLYRSQEMSDQRHEWAVRWAKARPADSTWIPRSEEQKKFDNEQAMKRALDRLKK